MSRRLTEKGKIYHEERNRKACKSIVSHIKRIQQKVEWNSNKFDNVHLVQSDLEIVDQLGDELKEHYEQWLTYLDTETDVHQAHKWYEKVRHEIDAFGAGINDWITVAKNEIEKGLSSPSEQLEECTSQQSSKSVARARLAELQTQSELLERKQLLRNQMERLEIDEKIAIAKARERALGNAEIGQQSIASQIKSLPIQLPSRPKENFEDFKAASSIGALNYPRYSRQDRDERPPTKDQREAYEFPATPIRIRPTPPAIQVSPIQSSIFTTKSYRDDAIDKYSHHRSAENVRRPPTHRTPRTYGQSKEIKSKYEPLPTPSRGTYSYNREENPRLVSTPTRMQNTYRYPRDTKGDIDIQQRQTPTNANRQPRDFKNDIPTTPRVSTPTNTYRHPRYIKKDIDTLQRSPIATNTYRHPRDIKNDIDSPPRPSNTYIEAKDSKPPLKESPHEVPGRIRERFELPFFQDPPQSVYRHEAARNEVAIATFLDRQNRLTEILSEQQQRSLLPPLTLTTFSNDPAEFTTFMKNFETQIETKVHSNDIRLRYLDQYLEGESKDLIKGCHHKDANTGYLEAKKLLKEKYGDPYKVSNAYIKKAAEWPNIQHGDNAALDRLSTFLSSCVSAMESMNYLSILDHPQNLQNLVKKLPLYLQDRWRRHVVNLREKSDCHIPRFKNFADFIKTEVKVATDPVFSKEALEKSNPKERSTKSVKPKATKDTYRVYSHATTSELPTVSHPSPNMAKCILCNGTHDLDDCKEFNNKSLDDRKDFLKQKQTCFACYGQGHRSRGCIQKRICKFCQGRHPSGLHDPNFSKPESKQSSNTNRVSTSRTVTTEASNTSKQVKDAQFMPIVPVKLHYMDKQMSTYAMLDNCSTGTFITDDIYEKMQIEGTETKVLIGTMNGEILHDTRAVTGLSVSDLETGTIIKLPRTFTREKIPASEEDIPHREKAKQWQHLQRIADQIPERLHDSTIGILIGADCPKALEPKNVIPCTGSGPCAILTFAGWTVIGPQVNPIKDKETPDVETTAHNIHFVSSVKEVILPTALNRMMDLEFNERNNCSEVTYSQEDKRFLQILEDGLKKEDGHFVMPLPFRRYNLSMPDNKEQAISRAMYLKRRLSNNPKMYADYLKTMNEILENDYARRVPPERVTEQGKTWYLPHHGVYHPQKPEKIRVVFDCSAKFNGISLNSELLQGPNLTSSLVGVLTRFRKEPIAFQADIQAMFHQVVVKEEHRDFLKFLWWPNGDLSQNLEEYQMNVHLFGAVSSPSVANFAVLKTADIAEEQGNKETSEVLRRNFYVDDCLRSEETEKKALDCLQSTIKACKEGGFHLTKITINSRQVLQKVPEEDRSKEVKRIDLCLDDLPVERALGVHWHIESDTFRFKITLKDKPLTRRGILSTISSVYDPLGFAAPVLLPGKRILQDLCKTDVNWDDDIPDEHAYRWERWRSKLPKLEGLITDRCLKPTNFGTVINSQIHNFSDASSYGYGQVSYLRQVNTKGRIHCAFLMGKARLAPIIYHT